jgi:hypothetical protein
LSEDNEPDEAFFAKAAGSDLADEGGTTGSFPFGVGFDTIRGLGGGLRNGLDALGCLDRGTTNVRDGPGTLGSVTKPFRAGSRAGLEAGVRSGGRGLLAVVALATTGGAVLGGSTVFVIPNDAGRDLRFGVALGGRYGG